MADPQTQNPNHSLDRRREEKNIENIVQDSIGRMTELTSSQMEVWQKQMALGSQFANFWADAFNVGEKSLSRFVDTVQQQRKSA